MKKTTLFLCIFSIAFLMGTAAFAKESDCHVIKDIPSGGIVISEPGKYVFAKNIIWEPTSSTAAITIAASHVILDMRGFTLRSITTPFKTIGILAQANTDIEIINGKIQNMGLFGIETLQCIDVTIKNIVIDRLTVDDTISFTEPAGIIANDCINVVISKSVVKNLNVKAASVSGIQFNSTIGANVSNSKILNLLNRDGVGAGIGHLLSLDIIIQSCRINRIKTQFINNNNVSGHTAIGIVPFLSSNITILDTHISNVTGTCDDAHGISLFVCFNAVVERCKVRNVLDGTGSAKTGAKATGIEVYASDIVVSDCLVKNIVAIRPQNLQSAGFSVALANNVKFIRCRAENVKVVDPKHRHDPDLGYGIGFGWAPDPRPEFLAPASNVLYLDCIAAECDVGFDTWDHINSRYVDIVSICNKIPILTESNTAERTLTCNACSECGCIGPGCFPTPYSVTITNQASNNTFERVKVINCKR